MKSQGRRLINKLFAVMLSLAVLAPYVPQAVIGADTAYAAPSGVVMLEDFENGLGNVRLEKKRVFDGSLSLESNPKYVRNGAYSARIDYDMIGIEDNPSQISIGAVPYTIPIQGYPQKIGMWVYANKDGHLLTTKFRDGNSSSFEMEHYADESVGIDWTGWRYLEVDIEQGKPAPIVLELFLQMKQRDIGKKNKGSIWVDDIRLIYDPVDEDTTVPTLAAVYPTPDQTVNAPISDISLAASDFGTGIDPASLCLTIDGRPFAPSAFENGVAVFSPGAAMGGGYHEAVAEARDLAGNPARIEYTFRVEHGERLAMTAPAEAKSGVPFHVLLQAQDISVAESVYATIQFDPATLQARNVAERADLIGVHADIDNVGGSVKFSAAGLNGASAAPLANIEFEVNRNAKMERGETYKSVRMIEGGLGYAGDVSIPSFAAPIRYGLGFAYQLEANGTSLGTESVFTVKDGNGAPVQGARIEFTDPNGPQTYVTVTAPQSKVYTNADSSSAVKLELGQGRQLLATVGATSGFVQAFLPDGSGMGWIPSADVQQEDLAQGIGLTDAQGQVRTKLATLAKGVWFLQAVKDNGLSERLTFAVVPQFGPERPLYVQTYVSEDMATKLSVAWQTAPSVPQNYIQYVKESELPQGNPELAEGHATAAAANSVLQLLSQTENGPKGEIRFHQAFVSGLQPSTKYYYRVGYEGHWSDWYGYSTAPSGQNTPVSFVFVTDSHTKEDNGLEIYQRLMGNVFENYPNTRFVMHGGDIVDNGGALNEWNRFWEASSIYATSVPSAQAIGNHDVKSEGKDVFTRGTGFPDNGPDSQKKYAYSFDTGNAHFVVLNSEATEENMIKQAEWLEADLAKSKKKWKVAMFHRPAYHTEAGRDKLIEYTQTYFAPILEKQGVDLVLVGHDHVYARTYPMKQGQPLKNGERGTLYLDGGASGWKFYDGTKYDYLDFVFDDNVAVYSAIEIGQDRIQIQARTENGDLVDDHTIVKKDPSPGTPSPGTPSSPSGGAKPNPQPDPSVNESGLPIRSVTDAEWAKAQSEGKLSITIAGTGGEVRLPANAGDALKNGGLELTVGGSLVLKLSPAQLRSAAAGLGSGEWLALEVVVDEAAKSAERVRQAQQKEKATLTQVAGAFRISLSSLDADGKREHKNGAANATLTIPAGTKNKLTGVYEIAADGTATYVKGKRTANGTEVDLVPGRTYMLLDYKMSYADLPSGHWAYEYVAQLAASRSVNGIDGERFAPNREVTRAEFTAMLVRELGLQASSQAGFADVAQGTWYAEAIAAAKEAGLVNGSSGSAFRPAAGISRQEMAAMIVRAYEILHGTAVQGANGGNTFSDMSGAQAWAKEAVAKAHELGLVNGSGNGKFRPLAGGTRAESAKLIVALLESRP